MRIGLHDAEKEHMHDKVFPNYALMKISAWHKAQGDEVEWHMAISRTYDKVYSSKVFDFTPINAYLPEHTIYGGQVQYFSTSATKIAKGTIQGHEEIC